MGLFCRGMSVSHLLGLWAFRLVLLVVGNDVVKFKLLLGGTKGTGTDFGGVYISDNCTCNYFTFVYEI